MTKTVTNQTVAAAKAGHQDAVSHIITAMRPQTTKMVNKLVGQYHREDATSEASLALWEAVVSYNPDSSAAFMTYAHGKIRIALMSFVSTNNPGPTVPERSVKRYQSNMDKAGGDPQKALRMVEAANNVTDVGSPEAFVAAHNALTYPTNINKMTHLQNADGEIVSDDVYDSRVDVSTTATNNVMTASMLASLTPRQANILERTYGLNGYTEQKDNDIATALNISRPRVVTIRKAALAVLATTNKGN